MEAAKKEDSTSVTEPTLTKAPEPTPAMPEEKAKPVEPLFPQMSCFIHPIHP
eukprot:CAMPEP_0174245372 /NCGR_PEP_ID=MMETSP0417-20130205/38624_1 /TAXON_ID=242541 /ORGANISM="Mayorella sp, Strain BSH-02190019" /LENGTH=51 /DNA_ID=CAMNT_0015325147 /DNA_START=48 /DNA_END=199 /DNA_ORIENTATION=-